MEKEVKNVINRIECILIEEMTTWKSTEKISTRNWHKLEKRLSNYIAGAFFDIKYKNK